MISRRVFLGGLLTLGAAGCSGVIDRTTQPDVPDTIKPPGGTDRHPTAHLLNRATFGPRPGQIEAVEGQGHDEWLEQQLDYRDIDDRAVDLRLRRFDTLKLEAPDLLGFNGGANRDLVRDELAVMTLLRAVYSNRQLYEVMVGFWSDHFSLYHYKTDVSLLKTEDDREVIRPHTLGKFGDMLRASAHSPAMLLYLDNVLNEKSHPNENYAREIMELHTLGVEGGYTEQDIQEVARCFTGWTFTGSGRFEFNAEWHDDGEKTVLGNVISAGGGKSDGDKVLDILLDHPGTARFLCTKLARRFVADDPPPSLVDSCAATWTTTDGDIRDVLRTLFAHPEFSTAVPKLKRPFELLTSLLRATNAAYDGDRALIDVLDHMGHRPFACATPDGYPDTASDWKGSLLGRWNLCLDALENRLPGVKLNDLDELAEAGDAKSKEERLAFFGRLFLARDLTAEESGALSPFVENTKEVLALLLGSPAYQWR